MTLNHSRAVIYALNLRILGSGDGSAITWKQTQSDLFIY